MPFKIHLMLLLLCVSLILAQEAQGPKDLAALLEEANGGKQSTTENLDALIDSVFTPVKEATTAPSSGPNLQPNLGTPSEGGIPGTGTCTCVPYYLCNNGTINTSGVGIIDIRINDGPCETYIDVCCEKEDTLKEPVTPTPPTTPKKTGCGYSNPDGIGFRITGDKENESQFGEYPWMCAILREETVEGNANKLNIYQCGGALIHPQVVITAAHCVSNTKKQFKVRAGEWDTQHTKELYPYQDREVETVVIHPQYYAGALYNDVALLYLKSPVEIAENVNVVCLPPANTAVENTRCYATGWGKDVFGKKGKYQVILKKIDLPIVPRDTCQDQLRTTRLGKYFELHRSFICAGGEPEKDTCKGDGGSPLVCPIGGKGDRYFQAGIVAWGIGCGDNNVPGVYVNLALFREWIDEKMKAFKLESSGYNY